MVEVGFQNNRIFQEGKRVGRTSCDEERACAKAWKRETPPCALSNSRPQEHKVSSGDEAGMGWFVSQVGKAGS